jgi:hypothetical protein
MMIFTAEQKRKAVDRELSYRRRVYARRVADGKMSPQLAAEQIAIFEAIEDDYAAAEQRERLL